MAYTYNKLRGRIVEKYRTQKNFAEAAGISAQTANKKLNGGLGFSQEDVEKWAKALEIQKCEYWEYFYT